MPSPIKIVFVGDLKTDKMVKDYKTFAQQIASTKISIAGNDSPEAVKQAKQIITLQTQIAQQQAVIERAKAATIATGIKEIQAEKAIEQAISATITTQSKAIQLEQQRLKLASQTASASKQPAKTVDTDLRAAAIDIAKYEKQRSAMHQSANRSIEASDKALTKVVVAEMNTQISELKKLENQTKSQSSSPSVFAQVFGGDVAARSVTEVISLTKSAASEVVNLGVEAVKLASDFEVTTNALTVFTGSTRIANQELASIDKTAQDTVGLRMASAEEGYTRLRALGFAAETSRTLIAGLGKERVLSGSSEQDINRVIVNLTQLSAGSSRASADIKEIIHAIPSLRGAFRDAFETTDPKKIQKFFETDPDKAVEKLAAAMSKIQTPAAGLEDSLGKASDAAITAGREFGKPILEPFTDSVKKLTAYLKENQGSWSGWGQDVGDIIAGATKLIQDFSAEETRLAAERKAREGNQDDSPPLLQTLTGMSDEQYKGMLGFGLAGALFTSAKIEGREIRQQKQASQVTTQGVGDFPDNIKLPDGTTTSPNELSKVARVGLDTSESRRADAAERAKTKEIDILKAGAKEAEGILSNRAAVEQSIRDLQIRNTLQDELNFTKKEGAARKSEIESSIAQQNGYYDKLIALNAGNDDEILKLQKEKNVSIGGLNKDLQVTENETARKILDYERQINEQRRQAAIQTKQIQLDSIQQSLNQQQYFVDQTEAGYGGLLKSTQDVYAEMRTSAAETYLLQTQDLSLTNEQKINLQATFYNSLNKLADDHRRSVDAIEQKQYQERLRSSELLSKLTYPIDLYALMYPWLVENTTWEDEYTEEKKMFVESGFDGVRTKEKLETILNEDQHLKACCVDLFGFVKCLNNLFITGVLDVTNNKLPSDSYFEEITEKFSDFLYSQPFIGLTFSHLFNFHSDLEYLDFGNLEVRKLDDFSISKLLGESTYQSFLHPQGIGRHFIVSKTSDIIPNDINWVFEEKNKAETLAQIFQYFKDGVIHINYSSHYFHPEWVNSIRRNGIFFIGEQRKFPYENGSRMYSISLEDYQQVMEWWKLFQIPENLNKFDENRNDLGNHILGAGTFYESSHSHFDPVRRLIDLAIALEALFSPHNQGEITFQISQLCAQLVGENANEKREIFEVIKAMYGKRSKLFHGSVDVYNESFVSVDEIEKWASLIRRSLLKLITLYLRGEEKHKKIIEWIREGFFDANKVEELQRLSDINIFISEMNNLNKRFHN